MEKLDELRQLLRKGVVEFTYTKKNGEQRTARGTLNMDEIPVDKHPQSGVDNSNDEVTRYYDLNSCGWRSFVNDNFIGIV